MKLRWIFIHITIILNQTGHLLNNTFVFQRNVWSFKEICLFEERQWIKWSFKSQKLEVNSKQTPSKWWNVFKLFSAKKRLLISKSAREEKENRAFRRGLLRLSGGSALDDLWPWKPMQWNVSISREVVASQRTEHNETVVMVSSRDSSRGDKWQKSGAGAGREKKQSQRSQKGQDGRLWERRTVGAK